MFLKKIAACATLVLLLAQAADAGILRGASTNGSLITGRVVQNGFGCSSSGTQGSSYIYKNFFKCWGDSGSISGNGNNLTTSLNADQFPNGALANNLGGSLFLPPDIYLGPVRFKWTGTMSGTGIFVGLNMTATSGGSFLSGNSFSGTDGDVTFNINATTTSTTSNSIGLGNKTFTVGTGLSISTGDRMTVAQTGSLTNYAIGNVVSYSGSTLVLNVSSVFGSGTFTSWNLWLAPDNTNSFFWGGTTFSNMSSIILCRDQDFATVSSDPFYHKFLSVLATENLLILRPMGASLNGGNEALSNPNWALRKPLTLMSYGMPSIPPSVSAGNISGVDGLTTGSYPSMPGSWTDKEAFTFFNPSSSTLTVTVASPARFTLPKSVVVGEVFAIYTTGALPTGLTASTNFVSQNVFTVRSCGCVKFYYALDAGSSNIRVAETPGGVPVNTTGTQSGTHSMSATTARPIITVANNGSNIPRISIPSTSGIATNDIVQVNMGNIGAFKVTVINGTDLDLSTSYPSTAVLPCGGASCTSNAGQIWSTQTGNSPIDDPGVNGRSYITITSINVGSRGAKPVVGTAGMPLPPGGLGVSSNIALGGLNACVYDAVSDMVMCGPGGLYSMGIPIELQVALANKLNKHLWYSFPAAVTTSTVTSSCQYVAANLNSNLKMYSGYGNENWNNAFTQYTYLQRYGVSNNYAYNNSGGVQQNYTATGLRTIQTQQACKTAWTGTGRSATSLVRLIQHQAASDLALTRDFLYNGNDLPGPNNAFPNRPVDNADAGSFADYWHGVLLNSDYGGSGSEYAALLTAGTNYASGNSTLMASALAWVYGDYMGTNGTATPTGVGDFSVNSQTHTGGTNLGIAPRWEGLFASYDVQRAGGGLAPIDGVLYEGGPDARSPTLGQLANLGITQLSGSVSWTNSRPTFTWVGNTLQNGFRIKIPSGVSISGYSQFQDFFVVNLSGNNFDVSPAYTSVGSVVPNNTGSGTASYDQYGLDNLLSAFKYDALGAQMVVDGQSAFVNATNFPHIKNGSFLQLEGPNEWSLLSGDFFSRPYQFFNGAVQYNQ